MRRHLTGQLIERFRRGSLATYAVNPPVDVAPGDHLRFDQERMRVKVVRTRSKKWAPIFVASLAGTVSSLDIMWLGEVAG